jgi:uncharacterized protein
MPRMGIADLPLHGGKAPRWLFVRMVSLASAISRVMILEHGTEEYMRRLSDPFWFQAFSCVLGFDWHSSGTTTVTCGALKEALRDSQDLAVVGGKGKASGTAMEGIASKRKAMDFSEEMERRLKHSSRISAKVDSAAVQDGHSLYHHSFIFDRNGNWATIQQGMADSGYARRYHWFSGDLDNLIEEPHSAILGRRHPEVLDMTSRESAECRATSVDLINDGVDRLRREVVTLDEGQTTLFQWSGQRELRLIMPRSINWTAMARAYEFSPRGYEDLLSVQGVGQSTVRALALISELLYGNRVSWKDPVKYSFAVGGKDGVPFPVDRKAMEESTWMLMDGIDQANIGNTDRLRAVERLRRFVPPDLFDIRNRSSLRSAAKK